MNPDDDGFSWNELLAPKVLSRATYRQITVSLPESCLLTLRTRDAQRGSSASQWFP